MFEPILKKEKKKKIQVFRVALCFDLQDGKFKNIVLSKNADIYMHVLQTEVNELMNIVGHFCLSNY